MELVTTTAGYEMLLRWGHLLAGITWIGLLYYFNLVQGEFFKEAEAATKSDVIQKLVPRALCWFRWGALVTLVTGLEYLASGVAAVQSIFMLVLCWVLLCLQMFG